MNGVLNIDKPSRMTSHDVVGRVRRIARLKRVGHAGTLDPDATGVLLVCVGQATRIADFLASEGKAYRAVLALGVTTSTEDASGTVLSERDAAKITRDDLQSVLPRFIGEIAQVPPMVSAVHYEGRRLYELAHAGITVERQARQVSIDRIDLIAFVAGTHPTAVLEITCGKGTYIRTLCADIGAALEVGGHMAELRRTRIGRFEIAEAVPLDQLDQTNITASLTRPADALSQLPACTIADDRERADILHGRSLSTSLETDLTARILDSDGTLLGLARISDGRVYPFKVFAAE